MTADPLERVRRAALVFWDFDGVVKESVDVKTRAFERLFATFGPEVQSRVRRHHEANGGMTRAEKIPLYLQFAGQPVSAGRVSELCETFGTLVRDAVIDAPWVPGAERYIRANPHGQRFIVVSATPQAEMDHIVDALDLRRCFEAVFGAPTSKPTAIGATLARTGLPPERTVMIGDATADLEAAAVHGVPFILRAHASNESVTRGFGGVVVPDLSCL